MAARVGVGVLLLGLGVGCAHTHISTNDPRAKIYADGEYLGRGDAEYHDRTGLPGSMTVTVKTSYAKVDREVDREFTLTTFVAGLCTYLTGWLWAWQYPETIVVMLPERRGGPGGWDDAPSAWDLAPTAAGPETPAPGDRWR